MNNISNNVEKEEKQEQTFTESLIYRLDVLNNELEWLNNRLYGLSKRSGIYNSECVKDESNRAICTENSESTAILRLTECLELSHCNVVDIQRRVSELERYV